MRPSHPAPASERTSLSLNDLDVHGALDGIELTFGPMALFGDEIIEVFPDSKRAWAAKLLAAAALLQLNDTLARKDA